MHPRSSLVCHPSSLHLPLASWRARHALIPPPLPIPCDDISPSFPSGHLQMAPSHVPLFSCRPCLAHVALAPIPHLSRCHCSACCLSRLQGVALLCSSELRSPFPASCNADSSKEDQDRPFSSCQPCFLPGLPVNLATVWAGFL